MQLNTTKERLRADAPAYMLVDYIEKNEASFKLSESSVYYEFPLYKDNDNVIVSKIIIVSRYHGVLVFGTSKATKATANREIPDADAELDTVFGHLHARLTKQRTLRRDKKTLAFNLEPAIFAPNMEGFKGDLFVDSPVLADATALADFFEENEIARLEDRIFLEICAVIEGAKGLLATRVRDLTGYADDSKVALVAALEAEIRSFDLDQKHGYMNVLDGPQRIRGLAGSGKTVVLAMKAALTHLRYPDAKIVYTFHTKSLYQHVRRLITRFYRQYDDQDPNWENLMVRHAWGGRSREGVYHNACLDHGVIALTYSDVTHLQNPFDAACADLLSRTEVRPLYDYVFVDEGQDFPASFLKLCLKLAREQRFVYAYDELQNIFQAETPSVESIFGAGVELDEDVVLHKCYRNPLEVLVSAHSLGFGIYGDKIVQMLENKDHWEDVGYEVVSADFRQGGTVEILRPERNSPSSISKKNTIDEIIQCTVFNSAIEEIEAATVSIKDDITIQGLSPEDIVVICTDDRYAKSYLNALASRLAVHGIQSNNLNADTFGGEVFTREGCVTLTSVHRAKGNEAYSVYMLGVDALFHRINVRTRNMIFTAMTRAKAWLHISGVGEAAARFKAELDQAKSNCPRIAFKYPGEVELKIMKRDLSETASQKVERALEELVDDIPIEELKKVLETRLAKLGDERKKKFKK